MEVIPRFSFNLLIFLQSGEGYSFMSAYRVVAYSKIMWEVSVGFCYHFLVQSVGFGP